MIVTFQIEPYWTCLVTDPVWTPSEQRQRNTRMSQFMAAAAEATGKPMNNYAALHTWSVEDREAFWALMWSFAGVTAAKDYNQVITDSDLMPGATWFSGAELNFAENLLRKTGQDAALLFRDERGNREQLSWDELRNQVACVAAALRSWEIKPGDRVVGFLPNRPEAIVAMLAAASVGAVWSSSSPDFGVNGVLDRFSQIEPKVLFVADGYYYAGKTLDSLPRVQAIAEQLPSLVATVCVSYIAERADISALNNSYHFADLSQGSAALEFCPLPFDHPLYILYSSGTTGVPKCIVHSAGGTLLQHLKEHLLHTDLHDGERLFYFTTCGWMMWNWLASGLAAGATLMLFDGSPFHPDPGVLWRMAAEEGINVFGTSAKYLSALEKAGFVPGQEVDLSGLRTVLSTGSPLAHESYDYVYRDIKQDLQLSSIAGGTDIISCFVIGNPLLPVYRGEIQCRALAMKVEIFDDEGQAVVGEKGELVCTAPFPSMPIGFFNDPDGSRYRAAYFERFDNVWCHGDYAELTQNGGVIIYGRSDSVLNPGGVRIGTAEIYRIVEKFDSVTECIVIGQQWQDDVRVVLFLRMQPNCQLDDELRQQIRAAIRTEASPRHMPARVLEVPDIPRTISGKIVELAVRDTVHGLTVKNTDALANPEALEHFRNRPELRQ
jgi:acetoacetyl-CoA synthetase